MDPVVIVGAGLAGYSVARELRRLDRRTPITLISADGGDFYAKPMLSNAFALGKDAAALVTTPAATMAAQLDLNLLARTRVESIDTAARVLATGTGNLRYRRLVLALGADPIRLPLNGSGAGDVASINDLDDYARFRARLQAGARVCIIGAGLIGCEFANDLAAAGYRVAVVDPAAFPLSALLPEAAARRVEAGLAAAGVAWHLQRSVRAVEATPDGYRMLLDNATPIDVDTVISAVGLRPRTALALAAGLEVDRGIVVDRQLRTSAADVFALGDCAQIDGRLRPYVLPILHAAKALAASLAGNATAVEFPVMPVVIKTPSCPVAVQPVARGTDGRWIGEDSGGELRLRFLDRQDRLLGFALAGAGAVAERSRLARQMIS